METLLNDGWSFVGTWPGISLNSSMIWQSFEAVELFFREFHVWRGLAHIFIGQGRTATMEEYISEHLRSQISQWLAQTMRENPGAVISFLRQYHTYVPEYQSRIRVLMVSDTTTLTNNELCARFVGIRSLQTQIALYDQFGMYTEHFFKKEIEQVLNAHTDDSKARLDIYTTLTLPWSLSTLQAEEVASLTALEHLATKSSGLEVLASADPRRIRLWLGTNASHEINRLVNAFGWVPVFLHNPAWDEDHFVRQLTDFALHFCAQNKTGPDWLVGLEARLGQLKLKSEENKLRAESLARSLKLDAYEERIFEAFRLAMDSRNEAEYQVGLGSLAIQPIIDEACKRLDITDDMFHCLYTEEVAKLLDGSLHLDDIPLSRLVIAGNWFRDERELQVMRISEAQEFQKRYRKYSLAASQSTLRAGGVGVSKGRAQGAVCIIRGPQDFMKFREGNILVADYTTANYVPLMRMAAGVITEHGGLTCHAAIISRELGIPAIVGYSGALQTFADGQQVHFDAADGVAHIMEHAKSEMAS